jgi:small subunit ribosomal protein S17
MGRPRKKTEEEKQEQVEATPAEEPEAEPTTEAEEPEPAAEAAEAPAEEPAPEPVAEEEPVAEAEAPAEEAPADEPAAEAPAEEPAATEAEPTAGDEEPVDEPAAEAGADAPAAAPAPEPKKRKHVPRGDRRQRTKPRREKPAQRKPITRLPKPDHVRGTRKERRGVVVSAAMDKTIVVRVDTVKPHPVYKKIVRRSTRLHAHDEGNAAKPGDLVRVVETRPLSKMKHWRLAEILQEAK